MVFASAPDLKIVARDAFISQRQFCCDPARTIVARNDRNLDAFEFERVERKAKHHHTRMWTPTLPGGSTIYPVADRRRLIRTSLNV